MQNNELDTVIEAVSNAIKSVGFESLKRLQAEIEKNLRELKKQHLILNYRVDFFEDEKVGMVTVTLPNNSEEQLGFQIP